MASLPSGPHANGPARAHSRKSSKQTAQATLQARMQATHRDMTAARTTGEHGQP